MNLEDNNKINLKTEQEESTHRVLNLHSFSVGIQCPRHSVHSVLPRLAKGAQCHHEASVGLQK